MAFWEEVSEEQLDRDHRSGLVGGTDMSTLMGHGYLQDGETHLDAIMRIWERKQGLGTRGFRANEAMRTGVEQEPVVYNRLMEALASGALNVLDERYEHARIYAPFRGMRIQVGRGDGYGIAGNMDAPLFDVRGEYQDPVTETTISGVEYARRYAEEYAKIEMQKAVNRARELDGEELWPVSKPKYTAPPFLGVIDIKVTQSASIFYDEIYNGVSPGFVVQTHHYAQVLQEESRRRGFDEENDPTLLGIYRACLENNKRHFHELEYDPELVAEMRRRERIFTEKCLIQGIPPNSSELRDEFYIYPVQGTEPAAKLPSEELEGKFKVLLDKHQEIKDRQKFLKESEANLLADLAKGVRLANGAGPGRSADTLAGVFVNERIVELGHKITNRKITNEAAVNGALLAAGEANKALSKIQEVLKADGLDEQERLERIAQAASMLEVDRLPREGTQLEDFQSVYRDKSAAASVSIKFNKNTRLAYKKLLAERVEPGLATVNLSETVEADSALQQDEVVKVDQETGSPPSTVDEVRLEGQQETVQVQPEGHQTGTGPKVESVAGNTDDAPFQPPKPAEYHATSHENKALPAESVHAGSEQDSKAPLVDTPVNDELQPIKAAEGVVQGEQGALMPADALEGLRAKEELEKFGGPSLLVGDIPEDLLDQALPEDLFESTSTGKQDIPASSENSVIGVHGLEVSPFS